MDQWTFDGGIGVLELEREFDTDLMALRLRHQPDGTRITQGMGVRLTRKEAAQIGMVLMGWGSHKGVPGW